MSTPQSKYPVELDEKDKATHDEIAGQDVFLETKYACELNAVSNLTVAYGRIQVARVFWKCMLACAVLNWAALNDGVGQVPRCIG